MRHKSYIKEGLTQALKHKAFFDSKYRVHAVNTYI